jgi:glutamate N-acetyltransferase/amino-acid N-acetyltransferase
MTGHISLQETPQIIRGIRLQAAAARIRRPDRKDLVLIELAEGSEAAAVFTQNAFCAAPVQLAKKHINETPPRYLLINSGNANAGTGQAGYNAAIECCTAVASLMDCHVSEVLPFSTGVIGQPIPVDRIVSSLPVLKQGLAEQNWQPASEAILTTDTHAKLYSCSVELDDQTVHLTGMAKGSGMIRPNMATMLAYIATDARVDKQLLHTCLQQAVNLSFNRITVDGDTSTNDAVVLMATGQANVEVDTANLEQFQSAVNEICIALAKAIVRDGEGATKLINVVVEQGKTVEECNQVAYAIAHSPLVKTAFFASDPNWGRILAAVGYSGVKDFEIDKVEIYLDDVCLVKDGGVAESYTEEQGQTVMQQNDITVRVNLNRGSAATTVWTCDFSYDYVKINAEYRT